MIDEGATAQRESRRSIDHGDPIKVVEKTRTRGWRRAFPQREGRGQTKERREKPSKRRERERGGGGKKKKKKKGNKRRKDPSAKARRSSEPWKPDRAEVAVTHLRTRWIIDAHVPFVKKFRPPSGAAAAAAAAGGDHPCSSSSFSSSSSSSSCSSCSLDRVRRSGTPPPSRGRAGERRRVRCDTLQLVKQLRGGRIAVNAATNFGISQQKAAHETGGGPLPPLSPSP